MDPSDLNLIVWSLGSPLITHSVPNDPNEGPPFLVQQVADFLGTHSFKPRFGLFWHGLNAVILTGSDNDVTAILVSFNEGFQLFCLFVCVEYFGFFHFASRRVHENYVESSVMAVYVLFYRD